MNFKKLRDKILNWFYDADFSWQCSGHRNEFRNDMSLDYYTINDEDKVAKGVAKEVMLDFWHWLDNLPEPDKKYAAYKEATGKYITGYLHDLEES